jgi:thiamine-phosphate diphosphorylase
MTDPNAPATARLPGRLLALTPGTLDERAAREFPHKAAAAVEAGLEAVLVREPGLPDRALLELARALREVLGPSRWLGVHDRVHLVAACGADAVHLGWRSLPPAEARALLAPGVALGLSAHAHDAPARWGEADYVVFGPVLETASKRGLVPPTGFDVLKRAVRSTRTPIWALGGLAPEHGREALAAGASGVAAIGSLLASADPASLTLRWRAALS